MGDSLGMSSPCIPTVANLVGLHLIASPPPVHLQALRSIPSESLAAQTLVSSRFPNTSTIVEFYTGQASFRPRPGKALDHPLNPKRGYLGKRSQLPLNSETETGNEVDDMEGKDDVEDTSDVGRGPPYELIYILGAIYHFPPSVPAFLSMSLPVLRPGSGVIAYTDILPPHLNSFLGNFILPKILNVPVRNLMQRPTTLVEYRKRVEKVGHIDVVVEDWSEGVWKGFARNLRERGGLWNWEGRGDGGEEWLEVHRCSSEKT